MAKIIRPNKDFPIFGGGSQSDELKIFGTEIESTDITLLLTNAKAAEGWASGVDANGFPALSWFNAVGHTLSYITAYYLQNGIPEWVALQEYFIGSQAKASNGFTYISKTNANIGNNPVGDSTNWRLAFLDSANTVVFNPTANYHPATKKYVDDNVTSLEIASTAEAQAGTNDTKAITPLKLREGLNASGPAPIYATRAWVNFNGTGVIAIRDSGNVSSVTDVGTGRYAVNFVTPMIDENYCASITFGFSTGSSIQLREIKRGTTTSQEFFITQVATITAVDVDEINMSIQR